MGSRAEHHARLGALGGEQMHNWKFGVATSIAVVVVLSAGCTSQTVTASSSSLIQHDDTITVAALPADDLAGLYVAEYEGLFTRQGLHVTIEKIASSQAIITDQLKGQVDISAGSYVPYIAAQAAGASFRILAEASTLNPDTRVLVVTRKSHITSIADLAGQKIGVNGTNSIGTLLVSALLEEHGISPRAVTFVTDPAGFPAMPGELQTGAWGAAFLAEPYVSIAEGDDGDQILTDLDQGTTLDFPIDGYVATRSWATRNPGQAAAFVHAIEEGQEIADTQRQVAQAAMAKYDDLPSWVAGVMTMPDFPTGAVDVARIQRVADAMLQFGVLAKKYSPEVQRGTLIRSMVS
jgi:NitT/TauT family transport system substrate-binding protein